MILLIGGLGNVGRNLETYFKRTTDQDVFVLAIKAIQELSAKVTALENATN